MQRCNSNEIYSWLSKIYGWNKSYQNHKLHLYVNLKRWDIGESIKKVIFVCAIPFAKSSSIKRCIDEVHFITKNSILWLMDNFPSRRKSKTNYGIISLVWYMKIFVWLILKNSWDGYLIHNKNFQPAVYSRFFANTKFSVTG